MKRRWKISTIPLFVNETNLSVAWAKAFDAVLQPGLRGLAPLVVNVSGLEEGPLPEIGAIRDLLDAALRQQGLANCHTVANTIFPQNLWERSAHRQEFYQHYLHILSKIKRRNPANRYGLYFERMISFGSGPQDGNQLQHLIDIWRNGTVRRPTAFQVNVFNPARDHTRQRLRGFPCLQHVCFTPLDKGKLAVLAVYPSQYLFERGYGNYLGLYRLGRFLAEELDLDFTQLTCAIGIALRGEATKTMLRNLMAGIQPHLQQSDNQLTVVAMAGGIHE
jgi:hypothetical protein